MRTRDATGQATAEYAGVLALVAATLLGTGAVVGVSGVGDAVAAGIRTGICIVGGDVCRASDAAAAGLEPCTVGERSEGGGATVSIDTSADASAGGRCGNWRASRPLNRAGDRPSSASSLRHARAATSAPNRCASGESASAAPASSDCNARSCAWSSADVIVRARAFDEHGSPREDAASDAASLPPGRTLTRRRRSHSTP